MMEGLHILIVICVIYCAILFFDLFFKSCVHYPYVAFLRGTGLEPGFFNIKWHTTAFNKPISQFIGYRHKTRAFLQIWFTIGSYVTICLLPIATAIVFKSGIDKLFPSTTKTQQSNHQQVSVEPIIIGVNVPINQLWYYCITIIFCSIVHELGHALAAVCEDVQILGIGANIVFIMTMAYVQIKTETLNSLSALKKLRILCAGIWHNLVFAFIMYLVFITLPTLFRPGYSTGVTTVAHVVPDSPISGPKGFEENDKILQINNCDVNNVDDWYDCLLKSSVEKPAICVKTDIAHEYDESVFIKHTSSGIIECCDETKRQNACFEYIEPKNGIMELPQHMCLPVRQVLENSFYCNSKNNFDCPNDHHCIRPVMNNSTSILHIKRKGKDDVIYIGHVTDVFKNVYVSNFAANYKFLPSRFPDYVQNLLRYLITCSLGLAIINVVPCFWFDGQFIIHTLVHELLLKIAKKRSTRNTIALGITIVGSFFIIVNFVITVIEHLL